MLLCWKSCQIGNNYSPTSMWEIVDFDLMGGSLIILQLVCCSVCGVQDSSNSQGGNIYVDEDFFQSRFYFLDE